MKTIAMTAAAAIAASMFATVGTPATAVPGVPAAAFDPTSVGWASYRDQSSSSFSSTFASKSAAGYLPVDLDIETAGGYRVGSVWQDNLDDRSWKEKRNLTSAQFSAEWNAAVAAGQRLVEQETYVVDGTRLYAGIWVENNEGAWASHRGQTNAQFVASFNDHVEDGLMPIDYDEYVTADGLRYNSVWVEKPVGTGWYLYRGLTSAGYSTKFAQLSDDYRVLAFDSLQYAGTQRYAGIWIENENGRAWAALRDMSAKSFDNNWYRFRDKGFRVVGYNRYQTAAGPRYAAIWRQNSSRPDWSLRSEVDDRVKQEIDNTPVPGVSVAVYQNGVARYLRGFGFADVDSATWMDSTHVGNIASVSKAVGGTLAMRMVEQNLVDLDDESRDWVPTMPAQHTHTLGQLLSNRGCVRHYVKALDGFTGGTYTTALSAADEFWDDPMLCDPTDPPEWHYSTHGYTLAGAVLEAAGNDDIFDLVRNKLTNPFGLGTLSADSMAGKPHQMSLYDGLDQHEISNPKVTWKVLGGGISSSVTDLARFGAKLVAGDILTEASLDTMWTKPDGAANYGYGWKLSTEDGTKVAAKDGSWDGNLAYLRVYPEKGIVVAVMMNSRDGGQSAELLGTDIGSIVLDSVS